MRGYFITFEGPDGAGKTTQIDLLRKYLLDKGLDVVVTREPGGTPISEAIRGIILDTDHSEMDPITEMYLYAASRAQHVGQLIAPALRQGKIVLCDRFVDSSIAYQGAGRGLGMKMVEEINRAALQGIMPDITLFLISIRKKGLLGDVSVIVRRTGWSWKTLIFTGKYIRVFVSYAICILKGLGASRPMET